VNKLIKQSQLYNVLNSILAEQSALQARATPYGSSPIDLEWAKPMHLYPLLPEDRIVNQKARMDDNISKPLQVEMLVCVLSKFQPLSRTLEVTAVDVLTQSLADSATNSETLQVLQDMVGKDATTVIVEVMDSYLEDAPQLLQAFYTAAVTGDAGGRHHAARSLKSSSTPLGATKLYQLCQDLEDMNKGGTTIAAPASVSKLEAEYEQVKAILHTERQRDQRYR
jgi:HPt (histidine-containing phosphotransfer) domain-containing protein